MLADKSNVGVHLQQVLRLGVQTEIELLISSQMSQCCTKPVTSMQHAAGNTPPQMAMLHKSRHRQCSQRLLVMG